MRRCALLLGALLAACAGARLNVAPEYRDRRIADARLGIVWPPLEPVRFDPKAPLWLRPRFEKLYREALPRGLPQRLETRSAFSDVGIASDLPGDHSRLLEPRSLLTGTATLTFKLPEDGERMGRAADFLLYLSDLEVVPARTSTDADTPVVHRARFAFWDNQVGALVCWGSVATPRGAQPVENEEGEILDRLADAILQGSPFR